MLSFREYYLVEIQDLITQEEIDQLIAHTNRTSSWIVFDDKVEETAIPLEKWKKIFAEDTSKKPCYSVELYGIRYINRLQKNYFDSIQMIKYIIAKYFPPYCDNS